MKYYRIDELEILFSIIQTKIETAKERKKLNIICSKYKDEHLNQKEMVSLLEKNHPNIVKKWQEEMDRIQKEEPVPEIYRELNSYSTVNIIRYKDKEFMKDINEGDIEILCGSTGSGKTTSICNFLNNNVKELSNKRILFITPRRTFADSLYNLFKAKLNNLFEILHYTKSFEKPNDLFNLVNDEQFKCILTIQLESLRHLKNTFDIVIIDELTSVLNQIDSSTMIDKYKPNTDKLKGFIKECEKLIVLDAVFDNRLIKILQLKKNDGKLLRINIHLNKRTKEDFYVYEYHDPYHEREQICRDLTNGKRIFLVYSEKKQMLLDMKIFEKFTDSIICHSADNSNEEEQKEIALDYNTNWAKYQLVAINSVITVGIDFSAIHFHRCYAFVTSKSCCARDTMQMIGRVRHLIDKEIFFHTTKNWKGLFKKTDLTDYDTVVKMIKSTDRINHQRVYNFLEEHINDRFCTVMPTKYGECYNYDIDHWLFGIHVENQLERNRSRVNIRSKLISILKLHGYQIIENEDRVKEIEEEKQIIQAYHCASVEDKEKLEVYYNKWKEYMNTPKVDEYQFTFEVQTDKGYEQLNIVEYLKILRKERNTTILQEWRTFDRITNEQAIQRKDNGQLTYSQVKELRINTFDNMFGEEGIQAINNELSNYQIQITQGQLPAEIYQWLDNRDNQKRMNKLVINWLLTFDQSLRSGLVSREINKQINIPGYNQDFRIMDTLDINKLVYYLSGIQGSLYDICTNQQGYLSLRCFYSENYIVENGQKYIEKEYCFRLLIQLLHTHRVDIGIINWVRNKDMHKVSEAIGLLLNKYGLQFFIPKDKKKIRKSVRIQGEIISLSYYSIEFIGYLRVLCKYYNYQRLHNDLKNLIMTPLDYCLEQKYGSILDRIIQKKDEFIQTKPVFSFPPSLIKAY